MSDGLLDPGQGTAVLNEIAAIARRCATDAIDEATAQGGDPGEIVNAQQELTNGDSLRTLGAFKDAVAKYKDTLAKAESALP